MSPSGIIVFRFGTEWSDVQILSPRPRDAGYAHQGCEFLACRRVAFRSKGEIDTATREFIHIFFFPRKSAGGLVTPGWTEIDGIWLFTFPPDALDCSVEGSVSCRPIWVEKLGP